MTRLGSISAGTWWSLAGGSKVVGAGAVGRPKLFTYRVMKTSYALLAGGCLSVVSIRCVTRVDFLPIWPLPPLPLFLMAARPIASRTCCKDIVRGDQCIYLG